jgi:CRISPR-associated protein Cas2
MHVLLIYDIVHDRQRTKVADACLDYGLDRIQYSAFAGNLVRTHQEELMLKIRAIVGEAPARVQLYLIDEKAWQKRIMLEQGMAAVTSSWEAPEQEESDVPRSADE